MAKGIFFYLLILVVLVVRIWGLIQPGFTGDVMLNREWGNRVLEVGLVESYTSQRPGVMHPNYPPSGMIIFATSALVEKILSTKIIIPTHIYYKIPATLADFLTGWLIYVWLKKLKVKSCKFIGLFYLWLPLSWFNSSYWGQVDSIFTLAGLISLYLLSRRKVFWASLMAVVAMSLKLQAILFIPAFLYGLIVGNNLSTKSIFKMLTGTLVGFLVVTMPFMINNEFKVLIDVVFGSVGFYPVLSLNAYNLWWATYADTARSIQSTAESFGISWRELGVAMWFVWIGSGVIRSLSDKKDEPLRDISNGMWRILAMTVIGFFLWNTEMHERYLFVFFPVSMMITLGSKMTGGWLTWVLICIFYWFNLAGVLPIFDFDKYYFSIFPKFDVFIAVGLSIFLLVYSWKLTYNSNK